MASGVAGSEDTNTNHLFTAWCSQHQMHPNDCFELHYPNAMRKEDDDTDAEGEA